MRFIAIWAVSNSSVFRFPRLMTWRVRLSGTVAELVWNDEAAEIYLGPTLTARMRERYPRPEQDDAA